MDATDSNRLIGGRGFIEYAAISPDLTLYIFLFIWVYLKSKVYKTKPNDIDDF